MARPKYTISAADLSHAWLYLADRVQLQSFELSAAARRAFWDIKSIQAESSRATKLAQADALNAWCEQNLASAEWSKLKAAIRKRRNRMHTNNDQIAITISRRAHAALVKLAKRDGVTLVRMVDKLVARR